jgi:choline dehydrogenase-like flavoprotein
VTLAPAAVATGNVEIVPDCYVHRLLRDRTGRIARAVFETAEGVQLTMTADAFMLACGGIESARLWQLSDLPNGNDLVGRNLTLHEFSCAVATFEEPTRPWVGGGCLGASTFDFYESDDARGFINGCHVMGSGGRTPWPINFVRHIGPDWGAEAKALDRALFNHTMASGFLLHDLPQAANRVDLDSSVKDEWGLPVARITHRMHENDVAQAVWFADRCGEILEASGASEVWRFPIERITGSAFHQHGTLRMGRDPDSSVLNPNCRAHEIPNLYVLDGSSFPTGSGLNPTLTIMANAWRVAEAAIAEAQV